MQDLKIGCAGVVAFCIVCGTATAQTNGRITGSAGDTAVDAAVTCALGMWSEVKTEDIGDGTEDTTGDGFSLKLAGAAGSSMVFGMFADGLGFESGIRGSLEDGHLRLIEPYHTLSTGERFPLDLTVNCDG